MKKKKIYLLVNFGGPRDLEEVEEFLICLFQDQEVLRTPLPALIHQFFFTKLAKKRARRVVHDYALIGGKSPIYEDTEAIAKQVAHLLGEPILTFHRYLPRTHASFIETLQNIPVNTEIRVVPLFAQFSYATTGSIAVWFKRHLPKMLVNRMVWVKSYPVDRAYLSVFEKCIREFLQQKSLKEEKTILLFSAHGLPQKFIQTGDIYERECQLTFYHLSSRFPQALSRLCYQSQFGKEEWLRPYTSDLCNTIDQWGKGYDNAVIVPLSFTSDHVETLFEVEQQYIPPITERGFRAFRCPALNQREEWLQAIAEMLQREDGVSTHMLIRVCQ